MEKQKLLDWIEMRLNEHKKATEEIHKREIWSDNDHKEYNHRIGARSELVFLRRCVAELNAFD